MTDKTITRLFNSDFTEHYQKYDKDSDYAKAYEKFQELSAVSADNLELSEYITAAENLIDQTALYYFKLGVKVGLDLGK